MKTKNLKNAIKLICVALLLAVTCICLTGAPVRARAEEEVRYADLISAYADVSSETINFTRREETYETTTNAVPLYYQSSEYPNSCGPTAGAIIVGFYDKYYEDLIPDYNPCVSNGKYKGTDRVYIPQLMGDLYTLMRTNVDDVGVSETDCLNGLKSYVTNHGRTLTYTNIKSSNKVNETSFTAAVRNNQPTLLFCSKVDLYTLGSASNFDTVAKIAYSGAHVAVAYGFYTVKYYNGDTNFRTDKYLQVATGLFGTPSGLFKLESTDWCNNAYVASIT